MSQGKAIDHKLHNLAHPGKRYQGQFIDGLIAVFLFAVCIYLARLLKLEGDYVDLLIVGIPFAYFVFSDALTSGQSLVE